MVEDAYKNLETGMKLHGIKPGESAFYLTIKENDPEKLIATINLQLKERIMTFERTIEDPSGSTTERVLLDGRQITSKKRLFKLK